MEAATPMSRPTSAPLAFRWNAGGGVVKLTCHRPDLSRVTRAEVAASILAHDRVTRNRTQPALGIDTSPHRPLICRTWRSRT